MRTITGVLILSAGILLGFEAGLVFVRVILPWLKSPGTMHVTAFLAGMEFSEWRLFIPFGLSLVGGTMMILFALWLLRRR